MYGETMKIILCQPSTQRFLWELDVFIINVRSLCNYEVILLFDNQNPQFADHFAQYENVSCFFYKDNREKPIYTSSIRPFLWVQFLKENPNMMDEDFFYVDSDIIFREMIDFDSLDFNEKKYLASPTIGYLGPQYIIGKGEFYLEEMAHIIGISMEQAASYLEDCGGAQWIISKPSVEFWEKVYHDCEALYRYFLLAEVMLRSQGETERLKNPIQKWCTDMWALLWNTAYFHIEVETPAELEFCWPFQQISEWDRVKILHDSGVTIQNKGKLFCKGKFYCKSPFDEENIEYDPTLCTMKYVEAIMYAKKWRENHESAGRVPNAKDCR